MNTDMSNFLLDKYTVQKTIASGADVHVYQVENVNDK